MIATNLPADELVRRAGGLRLAANAIGCTPRTIERWLREGLPASRCDAAAVAIGCHELELWTADEISTALSASHKRDTERYSRSADQVRLCWLAAHLGKHPSELDLPADLDNLSPTVARRYVTLVTQRESR